ncbi:hypothetical protein AAMO2058_000590900 [Amorphochlora amoebiformis]
MRRINKRVEKLTAEGKEFLKKHRRVEEDRRVVDIDNVYGVSNFQRAEIMGYHFQETESVEKEKVLSSSFLSHLLQEPQEIDSDLKGSEDCIPLGNSKQSSSSSSKRMPSSAKKQKKEKNLQGRHAIKSAGQTISTPPHRRSDREEIINTGPPSADVLWRPPLKIHVASNLSDATRRQLLKRGENEPSKDEIWRRLNAKKKKGKSSLKSRNNDSPLWKRPLVGSTGLFRSIKPKRDPHIRFGAWYLDVKHWTGKTREDVDGDVFFLSNFAFLLLISWIWIYFFWNLHLNFSKCVSYPLLLDSNWEAPKLKRSIQRKKSELSN